MRRIRAVKIETLKDIHHGRTEFRLLFWIACVGSVFTRFQLRRKSLRATENAAQVTSSPQP
jgi:hypothetical protein